MSNSRILASFKNQASRAIKMDIQSIVNRQERMSKNKKIYNNNNIQINNNNMHNYVNKYNKNNII